MDIFSMLKQSSSNKRQKQLITRFNYYCRSLHESLTEVSNSNPWPTKRASKDIGQSTYHYIRSARDNFQHFQLLSQPMLFNIAQQIYSAESKSAPQTINPFTAYQQKQIFIVPDYKYRSSHTDSHSQTSIISNLPSKIPQQYLIFIVRVNSMQNEWFYYVEKVTLTHRSDNESSVVYQSIYAVRKYIGFLHYILRPFLAQHTLVKYAQGYEQKLGMFCSTLQKQLKNLKIHNTKQYIKSHPSFKREDKLPMKQYQKFQRLKQEIYQYYSTINQSKKIKTYSMDNLICRFMKFKEYDYTESLKAIKFYLDWQKKMRNKYSYESFNKYTSLNLYEIIGKDNQGRLILLFRPHLIIVNTIQNEQEYIDYSLYMLDLYIEDHTEGYIDEFIIIADYQHFTTQNFKLGIARSVSEQSNQLFPDRQYKLICFGLGSFSYFIFKLIKPFLPSFILQKIAIFGTDRQEITQFLAQYMDINNLAPYIFQQQSPSSQN